MKFWRKRYRLLIGNKGKTLDLYEVEVIEKGKTKSFLKQRKRTKPILCMDF